METIRPPRKEPPLFKIACYWQDRIRENPEWWPEFRGLSIGLGEPFCFKCGWLAPVDDTQGAEKAWPMSSGWIVRAHLIDRCSNGLDSVQNIVPLCHLCHDRMPDFPSGTEIEVLDWLRNPTQRPVWWQIWTDSLSPESTKGASLLKRAWVKLLEILVEAGNQE